MDYSERVIKKLKVNSNALTLRRMIREVIHNQQEADMFENFVKGYASNKIFKCICEFAKIKNNIDVKTA